MYSTVEQPIPAETVALAQGFAGYAAVAVADAALYHSAIDETRHMNEALKTCATIDQAKGILMVTRRCTLDQAFDLLTQALPEPEP